MELIFWAVFACGFLALMGSLAAWIATQKLRSAAEGFFLGFLFGPLGVLVEVLLPDGDDRRRRRRPSRRRPSLMDEPEVDEGKVSNFLRKID